MEGARLGPYQLLGELGSGGMGKVFRAEVTGPAAGLESGAAVALKVIHAHLLETPGFFKRFLREADIGRTIEHENVVRTYDCDALLHDGVQQNFLVMEYVEGQTLRDLLQELERVPEELCRHIGREVAQGLAAIHEAGVVHRDLKPENVLITPDHVVKVMDLGVARLQDEAIRLSRAGAFVGSLEYAAPEQFRKADGEPDGRADLHALGVVLYELATGLHPYHDEDVSKVLRRILDEEPRRAGEVNPQLSPFFEEVVHTLIAKDRGERFASASVLAVALDEGEDGGWWKERARALRVETKRPLRRIRVPRETALYGRDDDLAKLHRLYEKAKAGDGQVLLIEGEAGIGKTRLVDEFVGRLRQEGEDLSFLFGSYPPGGAATAAGAFTTALREHLGEEGLEETLPQYIEPTPLLVPAFAALLRGGMTPTGAEALTKDSLQTVFVHATRGLAAERTTLVLIDDLHFAPEDGRALFSSLAMAVPEHRLLLIGTMRPGVPEDWIANVERLDQASRTVLSRLGPKDLSYLLKDAFRSERLARELGIQIAEKSDGNPFFAFEIIRGLREGEFITEGPDGTWVSTQVIQDIRMPSSVMDLVNARVAELSEDERELLDAASCCGFEFDPGLVAEVLDLPLLPTLKSFGQIERRHRLVRASGRRYTFDHHQVQEALYGSLFAQVAEHYHGSIAVALASRAGATESDPENLDGALCVELAEQYLKSTQSAEALRYLDAALKHLEQTYETDQTVAFIDRALQKPNLVMGARRVELLVRQAGHFDTLGRREAQQEVLETAAHVPEVARSPALQITVGRARGVLLYRLGEYREAQAILEATREIALQLGDLRQESVVLANLGLVFLALGDFEVARTTLEQGVELAQGAGARRSEAIAAGNLGNVYSLLDRPSEAQVQYERWLTLAREIGDRQSLANATGNLGLVLRALGQSVEAKRQFEQSCEIAREIGERQTEANAIGNLGNALIDLGRLAEAVEHFERCLSMFGEIGDRRGATVVTGALGNVWLALGRHAEARKQHEMHLALARDIENAQEEGYALHVLGVVAAQVGEHEEAVRLLEEATALRRKIRHGSGLAEGLAALGSVLADRGKHEAADRCLAEAMAIGRRLALPAVVLQAAARRAAEPGGDLPGALEGLTSRGDRCGVAVRMAARYHLWLASGDREHLNESKRLLDHLVEHSPEEYRESMLENVPLHSEIMEAWEERA